MKFMVHAVVQVASLVEVEVSDDGTVVQATSNAAIEASFPSMVVSNQPGKLPDESAALLRNYSVRVLLGRVMSRLNDEAKGQDVLVGVKKEGDDEDEGGHSINWRT